MEILSFYSRPLIRRETNNFDIVTSLESVSISLSFTNYSGRNRLWSDVSNLEQNRTIHALL